MFSSCQYQRAKNIDVYNIVLNNHPITCVSFLGLSIVQQRVIVVGNSLSVKRLYNCAGVVNISIINFPLLRQAYALLRYVEMRMGGQY